MFRLQLFLFVVVGDKPINIRCLSAAFTHLVFGLPIIEILILGPTWPKLFNVFSEMVTSMFYFSAVTPQFHNHLRSQIANVVSKCRAKRISAKKTCDYNLTVNSLGAMAWRTVTLFDMKSVQNEIALQWESLYYNCYMSY